MSLPQPADAPLLILIAEDSPPQAQLMRHILERHGYRVMHAANGRLALAMASQFKPAMIISDIVMPEMDGYALCEAVKADEALREIPVILVTLLSDSQDVIRALKCGADNFIRKPFDAHYLLEHVESILANLARRRTLPAQTSVAIEVGGQKHLITPQRQQILDMLISTCEQAIDLNNKLQQREQDLAHSNQVMLGLYRIAEGLNRAVSEQEVAETALELTMEMPGIQAGWITLRDGESGFRPVATRNLPPALLAEGALSGLCECRRRFLDGDRGLAPHIAECDWLKVAQAEARGLRYHAVVPLTLADGRALGVMNLAGPTPQLCSQEELKALYGIGNQVAVALERAHLHESLEKLVAERTARLMAEVTQRTQAETELRRLNEELEDRVAVRTGDLARANVALANREEEIRSVVDHMVDCVITIDESGIIRSANPAVGKVFGYAADEVVGKNISLLTPEPHFSHHDAYIERYCRTGQARIIGIGREVEGVHKSGERIAVDLAISEFSLQGRRFFTGILRDIRERVRIKEDLEQARHDAEQANRAKSAFLAAMSHEIRTPMNGVIGMIDVLHQTSLRGDQVEMVDLIRDSAFSLLSINEDILDFSKIEAGKLEIERAPLDLAKEVERACTMLDSLAETKGVELTLFIDPEIPEAVLGDAVRLRQVLINLANNAIKFSSRQPRPGRVAVRVTLAQPDPLTVRLQVADNGIGMDATTQTGLFTPFNQADVSTTRKFGGTGLGLAITRQLVELMGGTIEVLSAPEAGSTFNVNLPFTALPPGPEAAEASTLAAGLCCMVVGPEGQATDLAVYLRSAGARVEQVPDLTAAQDRIDTVASGQWVWVIDENKEPPTADHLRGLLRRRPDIQCRFVVIGHGQLYRRRRPRLVAADWVAVDGNLLTRATVVKAVAIAAGRAAEDRDLPVPGGRETPHRPPSRAEAMHQDRLILVAEDNETNQKVLLQQLSMLGYDADVAGNGRQALERLAGGEYAILLTDLHMPEMDGYQLATTIRSGEKGSMHLPIVALSANALSGEAERCRALGMDDYLSKPAPLRELRAMLERWLPAAEPLAEAPAPPPPVDPEVLKPLVGDDPAIILDFQQVFLAGAALTSAEMMAACAGAQWSRLGALAHKLKSSARAMGALGLGELCASLEAAGAKGQAEACAALWPRFQTEMAAVADYFRSP